MVLSEFVFPQTKRLVNHVIFEGNASIPRKTLINDLQLKPKRFLKGIMFRERALKLDILSLKNKYIAEGFINVSIYPETVLKNDRFIDIHYNISEGDRYYLHGVNVHGNEIVSLEAILQLLRIKTGDPYNPFLMSRLISDIEYLYFTNGKILVKVSADIVRHDTDIVSNITITEGVTYSISNIMISGIVHFPEGFVTREITFNIGDVYNIKEIERSQSRIFSSGLFSSVEIRPVIGSVRENNVIVEVKVREYSSKQVKTDLGLGQEPSSLGEGAPPASILELNVKWQPGTVPKSASRIEFGSNVTVRLDENITVPNLNYNVSWFTPWLIGFRLPIRIKYYHNEQIGERLDGIASSFIYRTSERYKLTGSVNIEYIKSSLESDQKRSIKMTYLEQKLDNFIYPTQGYFYSINSELNGTILGGEVHFLKFDLEYKKFYPLDKNITFGIHHRIGYLQSINYRHLNPDPIPSFYKFKLGGSTSLRGWKDTDDINPEGGMIRFQSNFEFRFPIFWLFGGEIFFDTGKLNDSVYKSIFQNWLWDAGMGITINSPIGPVRVDMAFPQGNWSEPTILLSILYLF